MYLTIAIDKFVSSRTSPRTQHTYQTALRRFSAFLTQRYDRTVKTTELDENDILDFAILLKSENASKFTIGTYLAAVIKFLKDLMNRKLLPRDFSVERVKISVEEHRKLGSYPIHEAKPVERIVEYWQNQPLPAPDGKEITRTRRLNILRGRALSLFVYATMCRIGEARSLDRKHVQDGRATEILLEHGKGDKKRYLFLPRLLDESGIEIPSIYKDARDAITAYIEERKDAYEPLFISHGRNRGKRLSETAMANMVNNPSRACGLHITPHDLRHARASQLINDAAPLEMISELMGHASVNTTKSVYAQYKKSTVMDAAIRFAPKAAPAA